MQFTDCRKEFVRTSVELSGFNHRRFGFVGAPPLVGSTGGGRKMQRRPAASLRLRRSPAKFMVQTTESIDNRASEAPSLQLPPSHAFVPPWQHMPQLSALSTHLDLAARSHARLKSGQGLGGVANLADQGQAGHLWGGTQSACAACVVSAAKASQARRRGARSLSHLAWPRQARMGKALAQVIPWQLTLGHHSPTLQAAWVKRGARHAPSAGAPDVAGAAAPGDSNRMAQW